MLKSRPIWILLAPLLACASTGGDSESPLVGAQERVQVEANAQEAISEKTTLGVALAELSQSIQAWNQLFLNGSEATDGRRLRNLQDRITLQTRKLFYEIVDQLETGPPINRRIAATAPGYPANEEGRSSLLNANSSSDDEAAVADALLALSLLGGPGASPGSLPYESLATQLLEDFGAADSNPETLVVEDLMADNCLVLSIGLYDLYLPTEAAADPESLEDYQRVALALLDSQSCWLDWLEPEVQDSRALKDALRDHKTLRKWVDGWKLRYVERGMKDGERNLLDVLSAKKSVREASASLALYFEGGQALGLDRPAGAREPIVLVEDRVRMVQLCSLGGWIYPQHRSVFWQSSIKTWTHFYIDDVKFLATRFAAPRSASDYATGMRMDGRTPTGLEQQIVQLATNSMLANYFGDAIPPTLAGGLAVNLVIDVYGECNTRADGDLRARRTSAREVFVPGGNPSGGLLPPNLADSRWRAEQGSDNFVSALKRAMPDRVRDGGYHFILENDRGRRGVQVSAPFLGSMAVASPLADEYYGDNLEFLRSYRCCFLSWLKENGAGRSSRSSEAFAKLLQGLASGTTDTLEALLATIYGVPLSSRTVGQEDLEGRFLGWLRKQR